MLIEAQSVCLGRGGGGRASLRAGFQKKVVLTRWPLSYPEGQKERKNVSRQTQLEEWWEMMKREAKRSQLMKALQAKLRNMNYILGAFGESP